jgi:uncharacterized membrane protein YhiD involved in acid resistance
MSKLETLAEFASTQIIYVPVWSFLFALIATAVLAFVLGYVYVKKGSSMSNRKEFARNFVLISLTTMFIITVVKSSLALSLGLVGALSIIRFRTAIKEPEELSYLFLAISIGLGMGSGQWLITLIGFFVIVVVIYIEGFTKEKEQNQNLYLTISTNIPSRVSLEVITNILKKHSTDLSMKRFDETREVLEASFLVEFPDFNSLNTSKNELKHLDDSIKITYLDNKRIH